MAQPFHEARRNTPMLTLGEAAKHTGVSKSTISRSVKAGRISAGIDEFGVYRIDPAELFRVYPAKQGNSRATDSVKRHATPPATPSATPVSGADIAALTTEIEGLRAQLRMMQGFMDDLKEDRDNWRDQAKATQRLLEDQRPRRWWRFG